MRTNKESEAFFTDCLCYESFFSVGFFSAFKIEWYFISESIIFSPFRKFLQKFTSLKFVCLDSVSYGDEYIDGVSLFEKIQQETKETIRLFLASKVVNEKIDTFSGRYLLNKDKINIFLASRYFPYIYRLIELKILIKHLKIDSPKILLKNSPISDFTATFDSQNVINYRIFLSNIFRIKKRQNCFYDSYHLMIPYYKSGRTLFFLGVLRKLRLISYFVSSKPSMGKRWDTKSLAIELVQRRLKFSETNDLFFTHNKELDDSSCCLIEEQIYTSHYDSDSYKSLKMRDFGRLKIFNLKTIFRQKRMGEIDKSFTTISLLKIIGVVQFIKDTFNVLRYPFLFKINDNYLPFLLRDYAFDSYLWNQIYKKFSISILWSMLDGAHQQATKSQGIELNDGIYAGSHWSNYPMTQVDTYKPHDIFFPWSEHFRDLFHIDFAPIENHVVGYISTDYLRLLRETSPKLRKEYQGKFIITFNDNIFYNDIAISESQYDEFYLLATEILEKNNDIVIFIKPKRAKLFRRKIKSYERLSDFINKGRARLFFSDNDRSKIAPAELAIESDLVIGLGISTTTLESIICNTPSLNLNFCKFPNNKFSERGLDKVVFNDRSKIYNEIKRIQNQDRKVHTNNQEEYYQILDPFLDDKSGHRVAKKLKNLLNRKSNLDKLHS